MLAALGAAVCVSLGQPRTATAQPAAQTNAMGDRASVDRVVTEVRQLLDEQRQLLEAQARVIEAQGRDIAELRRRLDGVAAGSRAEPAMPPEQVAASPGQVAAGQAAPETAPVNINPELPAAVVSAGDFPKSIGIPGTDAAFRIGGQARLMMVHSMGPLGTDDRFVTSSIPVEGQQQSGEDKRINYSAAASRANLDVRAPTSRGSIRTFLESDFAGESRTLRLRHAFIQNDRWLGGQTWSTFSDPEAEPLGIDFEGLNAISLFRQPQIRYTHPLGQAFNLALALENPAPDLTGASGVSVVPDFIARVRWQPQRPRQLLGRAEHIQTAVLVRGLRGEVADRPETTLSTGGYGLNVSGVMIPRWDSDDRVKFAANGGWGIGRYITDLGSLGGQDAVYDPVTDSLRALPVSSGYVGYERMWSQTFTTAVTYGVVNVSNLDIQPDTALRRTHRSTINLTWNPIPQASLVLEFLGGTRLNKDGNRGTSTQIQAGWLVVF
jgi:hypothetical protein